MHYRDLNVWNKSMDLTELVYDATTKYPKGEIYGLVSQMRRCAVSTPSNIAEGSRRKGNDTKQFLRIAYGSGSELETQLELSRRLKMITEERFSNIKSVLSEVMKMLNVMINR